MEPKKRQLTARSEGAQLSSDSMGTDFVTPTPVTLSELSVDPSTGRYRATRPVASEKQVDTKAEISKIRADRTRDAEASASARQFIQEHSDEITAMRAPKPSKKLLNYYKKKLAAQKATSEK